MAELLPWLVESYLLFALAQIPDIYAFMGQVIAEEGRNI